MSGDCSFWRLNCNEKYFGIFPEAFVSNGVAGGGGV